jgi:signal transduction histidine kinase
MSQRQPSVPLAARGGHRLSLERRLPLLITGLLALTLGVTLLVVYVAMRQTVEGAAHEQLRSATRAIADGYETIVPTTKLQFADFASSAPVRELLARGRAGEPLDPVLVRSVLRRFPLTRDTAQLVELLSPDGRRVAAAGATASESAGDQAAVSLGRLPREGLDDEPRDSVRVGGIFVDQGDVYHWIVAPVAGDSGPLGYLALRRGIRASENTTARLRALVGDEVTGYYRSLDGRTWSTLAGRPVSGPEGAPETRLSATDTIGGTGLVIVLQQPRAVALAPVRATFARLSALGLMVLALGAIGAWLISRRITRPLSTLTRAAEAVAQGHYGSRVEETGDEELARLAASFNHMATTVAASRAELQAQVGTARAMTGELESANERLQGANRQLQTAMEEASRARADAEEARANAEAANRAKSDFLAVMSHELRTPLNAIAGYAELMALGLRGPITEQQQRDLERIRASQEHLLGLISGVLDLSRIETGRVQYDIAPIALGPFLGSLDALVEPQAVAKALALELGSCPSGLTVLADREKLRQVLLNLLSNAIRYTPSGGRITIAAEARDDGTVAVTVRDTGIGIAPEALGQIFEPFVQLDRSLTRVRDGVGLGLAISRDLARAMGGELTAASAVGTGSTFTLTLPAAPAGSGTSLPITGEHVAVSAG